MCLKSAGCVANGVDPDQMSHVAASDQVLHCLLGLSVPILRVITLFIKLWCLICYSTEKLSIKRNPESTFYISLQKHVVGTHECSCLAEILKNTHSLVFTNTTTKNVF